MISPTFEPAQKPGAGFDAYARGVNEGQSWMDRAQGQTLRQQQIQHDIDNKPVEDAKRMADLTGYHAAIANGQILEETRRQAAEVAPQYLAEFLDITKIPDVDQKAAALDAFAGKTAWLGNMKENAGFANAVKDAQGKAHLDSIAQGKIAQLKAATQQRADTGEAQIEQRAKAAELKATTDVQMQSMKTEMEKMKQENQNLRSTTAATAKTDSAKIGAAATTSRPVVAAAVKANETTLQAGQTAAQELNNNNRALAILDDPDLRTGTGVQFELAAQRLGGLVGMDTGNAKNLEQLQSLFGDTLLAKAKQMKGNFSDRDREFVDRISPTIAKTPEGNKMILTVLKNQNERQMNIARIVNEGRGEGLSEREIQLEVNDYILNNPLSQGVSAKASTGTTIKSVKKIQ